MTASPRPTNLKICARILWQMDRIAFAMIESSVGAYRNAGKIAVVTNMTFETIDEGFEIPQAFTLRREEAQFLMDELWNCGVRPTEAAGSAGAMTAVQAHLSDMRKLVFEKARE